jgi:hypothetical protein
MACLALVFVALGFITSPTQAQNASETVSTINAPPPPAVALRAVPDAPKLDGRLDDEAWQDAPVITGFVQRDPEEGAPGTERTEAWVLYTDAAIYVAVRAYDSQADQIAANLTRRDEWSPSDRIGVGIDSYHDKRTAFYFQVNPAGVKRDVYYYNDNWQDDSWNAVWDVAVSRDSEGWTAEFRIPFSQLKFAAGQETFGFNIYRRINRTAEDLWWRLPPKEESGMVSKYGDLVGLQGIKPPRRVELMPYVSATNQQTPAVPGDPFRTGQDRYGSAGFDLTMGITSNFTLQATVNPDFGQVEADPAVVNLSAFETFFPEKRPFFIEGQDVFSFRLGGREQLFYTRRIGRRPQGSADARDGYAESVLWTTILGAAKVSGKTQSGWSLGFTGAVTAEEEANVIDGEGNPHQDVVEPRSYYGVASVSKDLRGGKTKVGLFSTILHRSLTPNLAWLRSDAYTLGLNFDHRFLNDGWGINGYFVGSNVRGSQVAIEGTQLSSARYYQRPDNDYVTFDPTRTSLGGYAGDLTIEKRSGDWRGALGGSTRSPGFEVNDVGFLQNADYWNQWAWVQRRWQQPGNVFRRFYVNFNQWSNWNHGWDRVNTGANVNSNWTFLNYWGGYAGVGRNLGGLSGTALRGGPGFITPNSWNGWMGFWSDGRKPLRAEISGWGGVQKESGGWNWGAELELAWRPLSNVDLAVAPSLSKRFNTWQYLQTDEALGSIHYVFGKIDQTTTSLTFRGSLTLNPNMSLQVYAQPFISSGNYVGYREVDDPRGATFDDRFTDYTDDQVHEENGEYFVDLNGNGEADIFLGNPNFTVLSFRSNVVLRWEYMLGSTIFLVWQHGREGFNNDGTFPVGQGMSEIFDAPAANSFVVKVTYWLSL